MDIFNLIHFTNNHSSTMKYYEIAECVDELRHSCSQINRFIYERPLKTAGASQRI